jgi:hypothetical protein
VSISRTRRVFLLPLQKRQCRHQVLPPSRQHQRRLLELHRATTQHWRLPKMQAHQRGVTVTRRYAACQQQSLSRLRPAAAANLSSPLPSTRRQPSTSSTASRPSEHGASSTACIENCLGPWPAIASPRAARLQLTSSVGGAIVHVSDCYVVDDLRHQLIIGGGTLLEYDALIQAVNGEWRVAFRKAGGARVPADRVPIGDIRRAPAEVTHAPQITSFADGMAILFPILAALPCLARAFVAPPASSTIDETVSSVVFRTPTGVGTHSLFVAMPDGPAFEVHGIGNDGVVSPVDIARGVWASTWAARRGTPPPIASVAAIGSTSATSSTTSYKFNSPVDEMLSNVRFDEIDMPDSERAGFRSHVREQLDRLHRHGLLIGKNSPGPQFPQAMRNVEHTISLCTDADLRKVSATWHPLPTH